MHCSSILPLQVGEPIPVGQLGFPSLEALLRSLPGVCSIERRGYDLTVLGVANKATAHVQDMVIEVCNVRGSSVCMVGMG